MSVLFTNIRSIMNKRDSLTSAIDTCNADILILTETWLQPEIHNHEILSHAHRFSFYRCDRTSRRGGGVLLAIKKDFQSHCIHVNTSLEIVWAVAELGFQKVLIGACYRPPSYCSDFVNELHDVINTVFLRYPNLPLFLLGDFNIPNITWATTPPTMHPFTTLGNDFLNICSLFSLTQVITQPTRLTQITANTLDLALTSRPDLVSDMTLLPGLSDHLLISFRINIPRPKASRKTKTIRDYKKANFSAINTELCSFLDRFLEGFDKRSVQSNWDMFLATVHDLSNRYIPVRRVIANHSAPWYTSHIRRLSNKKKTLI